MIAARIQCRQGEFSVDLEMEIPQGVTALLGPSGAGKTTVLQVLLGLIPMEEGSVHCDGELLERAPGGPRRPPEARRFGMVSSCSGWRGGGDGPIERADLVTSSKVFRSGYGVGVALGRGILTKARKRGPTLLQAFFPWGWSVGF